MHSRNAEHALFAPRVDARIGQRGCHQPAAQHGTLDRALLEVQLEAVAQGLVVPGPVDSGCDGFVLAVLERLLLLHHVGQALVPVGRFAFTQVNRVVERQVRVKHNFLKLVLNLCESVELRFVIIDQTCSHDSPCINAGVVGEIFMVKAQFVEIPSAGLAPYEVVNYVFTVFL